MSRVALLLFIFFILTSTFAQTIAAFTVNAAGAQELNIDTGITTLPEGGEIIDTERELKLNASFISYKDGEFIEAQGGTSEGPFGLLEAPELRFEVATNTISAAGGISLTKDGLSLVADTLTLDLNTDIAVLSGNIQSTEPAFEAAAIVIKLGSGYALLASPFNYANGIASITQESPGSLLQLKQIKNDDGTFSYNVSAKLDEAINTELSPYLP
jgi:hypothetical protein